MTIYDEDTTTCCYHCGQECSGDVTETVTIYDEVTAEKTVCDEPDECPANICDPYGCFCVLCLGGKK